MAGETAQSMACKGGNSWLEYGARLDRLTNYVFDYLNDALDLNKLAEVACLSPFRGHRADRAMRGQTIAATVRRLRLHRATRRHRCRTLVCP